jgi:hypothetical protein
VEIRPKKLSKNKNLKGDFFKGTTGMFTLIEPEITGSIKGEVKLKMNKLLKKNKRVEGKRI